MDKGTLLLRSSKSSDLCDCVMNDVACREERRLIRTLFLIGPLLIISTWLLVVAVHLSISHYVESQAITAVSNVEAETHSFAENAFIVFQLFLSQLKSDAFVLLGVSLTIITIIIAKSKLLTVPFRLKEIKKFKQS